MKGKYVGWSTSKIAKALFLQHGWNPDIAWNAAAIYTGVGLHTTSFRILSLLSSVKGELPVIPKADAVKFQALWVYADCLGNGNDAARQWFVSDEEFQF